MTQANVRLILHFEDEPSSAGWIPGALFNKFLMEYQEWESAGEEAFCEEPANTFMFTLGPPSGPVTICYKICQTAKEFADQLSSNEATSSAAIAILDVWTTEQDGKLIAHIHDVLPNALNHLTPARIFVLTAYPRSLPKELADKIPPENVFSKPLDAIVFMPILMKQLGIK